VDVIDGEGNLFGIVNVVDALVALLLLSIVVAGVALVDPFSSRENVTRSATIDLGEQPEYIAELIEEGDVMSPEGTSKNLTVTDVHVAPAEGENVSVTVRVEAEGHLEENDQRPGQSFVFAGKRMRQGNAFTVTAGKYDVSGTVVSLDTGGPDIDAQTTPITVESTVPASTARSVEAGDTYDLADSTVARVTDVHVGPGNESDTRHLVLGMAVEALNRSERSFGGEPLGVGRTVAFQGDGYAFEGVVTGLGNATVKSSTARVIVDATVSAETARTMDAGDAYRVDGERIGTITDLEIYPGQGDGQRAALVGVELSTVTRAGGQYFGDTEIALGERVPFRGDGYGFEGEIRTLGTATVATSETQVVVEATTSAETAEQVRVGDKYRVANETVATVETVSAYPTADEGQQRLVLGLDLRTVERGGTERFGTIPLRVGATIPFEADEYELAGAVVARGSLSPPGDRVTRTITVKMDNVHPEIADGVTAGLTEQRDGTTYASVTAVRTEPAVITLTSEGGDIFRREHPVNEDVYLTVEVQARETPSGLSFHGQPLREGSTVTLDFQSITVDGTVTAIEDDNSSALEPVPSRHTLTVPDRRP